MDSEFVLVLRDLTNPDKPLTNRLLAGLTGPSRDESAAFAACFPRLAPQRKRDLLARLVEMAESDFTLDFVALFRGCLNDADAVVRRHAVEGLWEDDRASLIEPLARLLASDPDVGVRAAAAISLGRFVFMAECEELDERRAGLVRTALEHTIANPREDVEVVRRAVEAIAFINDNQVRRIIDRAYASEDSRMRESAVFAMGRNADPIWAETVLAELHGDSPAMRYEAARACGELQFKRAVGPLIALVGDSDREVQGMAIWALGQIGGKRAQTALESWATGDDDVLASAASEALEEIKFANPDLNLLVYDYNTYDLDPASEEDEFDTEAEGEEEDPWEDDELLSLDE